ncbi:MAG: head-tail connector protein [Dehalococcoidia bacterium]|jgi:uncharacterized phiE125 gp8 family phage protein
MALKIKTAPSIEALTLSEVKAHLRLDSGDLANNITTVQSIAPGSHAIAASYSLKGAGVNVLGYRTLVNLNAGACGAGGSVDAKIQESDTDVDANYTDWTGGAFIRVTASNDNAVQKIGYTGTKEFIRVASTVAGAPCEFGADVIKEQPYSAEDDLLTTLIAVAREWCEGYQNRAYITQTWELWLDEWPGEDFVKIPLPPLQAVNSITYYDTDNVAATIDGDDYFVDDKSEPGKVVLAYGKSWPSTTLRPANGICIESDAGYGDAASDVPKRVKQAMLLLIAHLYEHPEAVHVGSSGTSIVEVPFAVKALLGLDRIWPV